MKPRILFLTNSRNEAPNEDRMLVQYLSSDFDLVVCHPRECSPLLDDVDGVIIRNIWPTHEYEDEWEAAKLHIRASGLPVYNSLGFRGDVEGKDYLMDLVAGGYPVIPSIDRVEDLQKLPQSQHYWIKPKNSCDGIGAEKMTREALLTRKPRGYIIQPFVEFDYEPSFFFVDNKYTHAMWERHRLLDDRVARYSPSSQDLDFAASFVRWAGQRYGVQRIDAIRLKDGRLLLTEVENLCPYLYLAEVDEATRMRFLQAMKASMLKVFACSASVVR